MKQMSLLGFSWENSLEMNRKAFYFLVIETEMKIFFEVNKKQEQWGCL